MFPPAVCNNGTILISGGCGGLGLAMARWMVEERGVKRLALMTRRTRDQLEQAENNPQLDDWLQLRRVAAEHGANINVVQIDVTRFDEVHEFIELLGQTSYPVRGIIHSALVIEDRVLSNLSMETLTQVMRPKVRGGWNLHNASHLARAPLHFFIMLSSLRNHMINVGSASYNAGNEFLDALAHYRREQLQLPAICISLPAISGAGIFHQRRNVLSSLFSSLGFETLPTGIAFELLEKFFVTQRHCPCPIIFAAKWETIVAHATPLWTHQLSQLIEQKMNPTTVSPLAGSNMDPTSPINSGTILERTRVTAAHLLGASTIVRIDVNRSLVSQGMDSLAAVSLYNWLSREFDVIIPISDILQGISINQIAAQVHSKTAGRSSAVAKKEVISSNKPQGTAVTTRRDIPLYTGMEKVLRYIQGSDSGYIVFFLSSSRITNDTLQSYLLEPYNALTIYVIHTPTFQSTEIACAQETIAQVRRIQPYGPYSIIAVDTESVLVAHEMLAQLQNHTHVGISRILSNDCEQLAQVSFTQSR